MHWGQIKTLLIFSFLILDVYLFVQFLDKKEVADIGIIEHEPSTIEEQLISESIAIAELPKQANEESYISVKQHLFTEEELISQDGVVKQDAIILNKNTVLSTLENPVSLPRRESSSNLNDLLQSTAYYADNYTFWRKNEKMNVLIYFQNKLDRPVYYNEKGYVLLFLNEDDEVTHYVQTMLGEEERLTEKRTLIEPIRAIETLYNANELNAGDHITKVDIGYHTRVPFESDVQVFAPIWKITVNDEKHYFVNAIEGFTFSTDEEEYLENITESTMKLLEGQSRKSKELESIQEDLQSRVQ